jgi:hypothetical protein
VPDAPATAYFTIDELRAEDETLSSADSYPDAMLADRIAMVEERIEHLCGVAFLPRTSTCSVRGDGSSTIILPDVEVTAISSIAVDGVDLTDAELALVRVARRGVLTRMGPLGRPIAWPRGSTLELEYTHGYAVPPAPIKYAALKWAVDVLLPSSLPARATMQSQGDNTFRIVVASPDRPSGIPEVDAILADYDRRIPMVG